jgi:hypothetical protein
MIARVAVLPFPDGQQPGDEGISPLAQAQQVSASPLFEVYGGPYWEPYWRPPQWSPYGAWRR